MKRVLLPLLTIAVLLGASTVCWAQATPAVPTAGGAKPVAVVSFAGYDKLLKDIELIGTLGGNPNLAKGLEGLLTLVTQGQGLAGVDKAKPWGAVVQTDGQQFPAFVFVPVTDGKKLLTLLAPAIGPSKDAGGGVLQFTPPKKGSGPSAVFAKEASGWLFFAPSPEPLAKTPADPATMLGGLEKKYDLAVRVMAQNVPAPMRQMVVQQMKAGAEAAMQRRPGEGDEEYAIRTGMTKQALDELGTTINELDEVTIGWAVDQSAKSSHLDVEVTAVKGSKLAGQFAQMKDAKTNFGGFDLPGAAVTVNVTGVLSDADVARAKKMLTDVRAKALADLASNEDITPKQQQVAKQVLGDLLDVALKTVESKKSDGGLVLLLNPGATTLVAGGAVADGAKLDKALKQVAAEVTREQPDIAQLLKLDAETYQGVRLHTLALPADDPNLAKMVGQKLEVVVGIGDQSVYVAAGSDPVKTLKQVMDSSKSAAAKQLPPVRIAVAATPILKFAEATTEGPAKARMAPLAKALADAAGKDHVTFVSKANASGNGASVRLELEEGILRLIGTGANQAMGMMMGGGGGPGGGDSPF